MNKNFANDFRISQFACLFIQFECGGACGAYLHINYVFAPEEQQKQHNPNNRVIDNTKPHTINNKNILSLACSNVNDLEAFQSRPFAC